jgi:hypothetical protein
MAVSLNLALPSVCTGDLDEVHPGAEEGGDDLCRGVRLHGLRHPLPPPLGRHLRLGHVTNSACVT